MGRVDRSTSKDTDVTWASMGTDHTEISVPAMVAPGQDSSVADSTSLDQDRDSFMAQPTWSNGQGPTVVPTLPQDGGESFVGSPGDSVKANAEDDDDDESSDDEAGKAVVQTKTDDDWSEVPTGRRPSLKNLGTTRAVLEKWGTGHFANVRKGTKPKHVRASLAEIDRPSVLSLAGSFGSTASVDELTDYDEEVRNSTEV